MDTEFARFHDYILSSSHVAVLCPRSYVFCYENQSFNTAFYLLNGKASLVKGRKFTELRAPHWIGLKEILDNTTATSDIHIHQGSEIIFISKKTIIDYFLIAKAT